jgi:hypothetical protein
LNFSAATLNNASPRIQITQNYLNVLGGQMGPGNMFGMFNFNASAVHDILIANWGCTNTDGSTTTFIDGRYAYNLTVSNCWCWGNECFVYSATAGCHDWAIVNNYHMGSTNIVDQTDCYSLGDMHNIVIQGNFIENRAPGNQSAGRHNDCIQTFQGGESNNGVPSGFVIRYNWIVQGEQSGDGSTSFTMMENLAQNGATDASDIYGNVFVFGAGTIFSGNGVTFDSCDSGAVVRFYNNTVINYASAGGGLPGGPTRFQNSGNLYAENNLFEAASAESGLVQWSWTIQKSDYNIYYNYASPGSTYAGTHGLENSDPRFNNFAGGDYSLQSSSPAIGAGDNSVGATYNQGIAPGSTWPNPTLVTRSGAWDVGAFVYASGNTNAVISVSPGSLNYGPLLVGATSNLSFTVQNVGTGTLTGTASVGLPFSIVSGGNYNLGANGSQTVTVAFNPGAASNYTQSVTFTGGGGTSATVAGSATNAPTPTPIIQVTPGSIAYGTILTGTSTTNSFTVQNTGAGTLTGTASVGSPFSIVSGGSYSLGANGSQTVMVAFIPGAASNYTQSVIFTGGAGTNTTVTGSATNAPVVLTPVIQVTPGSIAYGTILTGTSTTNTFVVQNVGTGTLTGTASVGSPFSIVSGGSYNLGANASQPVKVAFNPGAAGNYTQNVTFTGGAGTNTTVTGSATNAPVVLTPVIQVTPGSIAYGTILTGTSATNSFTVQNVGTGTLTGTASVGSPFSIISGGSYSLGANASQMVKVAFNPGAASNYTQSVIFTGGAGTITTVTGSATNVPPVLPAVSPISVDATDVDLSLSGLQIYAGTTVQFSATATNVQTWQWRYTVNGGSPVVYTNGTSPITNISCYFDTNTISNSYVWTLVVSNGQGWAESQTNLYVEAQPGPGGTITTNTGISFAATSGNLTSMFTATAIINGVSNSYIYLPLLPAGDISSGAAVYNFTITNAGNYEVQALVDAPSTDANSFYVNIDGQPQGSSMIWDIMPVTSGFEQRIVSWRGNGSENNDQIVPQVFSLGAGPHSIIFVGREPGTALAGFTLLQVLPASPAASQSILSMPVPPPATPDGLRYASPGTIPSSK